MLDNLPERAGAANMALRGVALTLWLKQTGQGGLGIHFGAYARDSKSKCGTKSLVGVVPTVKEGTTRVTGCIWGSEWRAILNGERS